ncbi:hypothetical protein B0O80DRAFT_258445 [Mortierella sp. GBAus27b]|nr:hypothetical protein B0O80DRAFT_258445 [Mortierella sp. GBAus27b]
MDTIRLNLGVGGHTQVQPLSPNGQMVLNSLTSQLPDADAELRRKKGLTVRTYLHWSIGLDRQAQRIGVGHNASETVNLHRSSCLHHDPDSSFEPFTSSSGSPVWFATANVSVTRALATAPVWCPATMERQSMQHQDGVSRSHYPGLLDATRSRERYPPRRVKVEETALAHLKWMKEGCRSQLFVHHRIANGTKTGFLSRLQFNHRVGI